MPLQLLPMEANESNIMLYYDICWEAFKNDIMALMYPNGFTQKARAWSLGKDLEAAQKYPDRIKWMKVIDTELPEDGPFGQAVGIAKWKFFPHDRTEAEMEAEKKESDEEGNPPDSNGPMIEEFLDKISEFKKEILGNRAHVLLHVLATLPQHHRRGIGAMHLKWGLEQADRLGVPAYLESSPAGKPLYTRMGFQEMKPFPFDARKWGLDHDLPHTCMLRQPEIADSRRNAGI